MLLFDVNVLVYAFRADAPDHDAYQSWLRSCIDSDQPYGVANLVLAGFLRVVTHPRVFNPASPIDAALSFLAVLRSQPNCVVIEPGPRHWEIFVRLCGLAGVKGNLVPDAYLAALAIESGSEWITSDRDYGRFPALRWRHPFR
jgi:toxin-antitoxin system PIN domain toxin